MRKQRRKAEQQDKQDRIRMGLIAPDAPKGPSESLIPSSQLNILLF